MTGTAEASYFEVGSPSAVAMHHMPHRTMRQNRTSTRGDRRCIRPPRTRTRRRAGLAMVDVGVDCAW